MKEGKSPVELFLFRFWKDYGEVSEGLNVSIPTARIWKEQPERMLRYLPNIQEATGATYAEIVEVVQEGRAWNNRKEK